MFRKNVKRSIAVLLLLENLQEGFASNFYKIIWWCCPIRAQFFLICSMVELGWLTLKHFQQKMAFLKKPILEIDWIIILFRNSNGTICRIWLWSMLLLTYTYMYGLCIMCASSEKKNTQHTSDLGFIGTSPLDHCMSSTCLPVPFIEFFPSNANVLVSNELFLSFSALHLNCLIHQKRFFSLQDSDRLKPGC